MPPPEADPLLVVDVHEPAGIEALLRERGVPLERRKLQPADYVVGEIGVERKTVSDFFNSLVRKRLFDQCERLAASYKAPYLLLEGDVAEFMERKQPTAAWGAMVHVVFDLRVPILPSPSKEASAQFLYVLWNRQRKEPSRAGVRWKPPGFASPQEEQKFVLQGLPLVGDRLSENLLTHFGTLRRTFAAKEKELLRVSLMGDIKAKAMTELLDRAYPRRDAQLPKE